MKILAHALVPLVLLVACGGDGSDNAGVVQAATKGAAELGEQLVDKAGVLAQKATEIAELKGEEARVKTQELFDAAAAELAEARDSETVKNAAAELDQALLKLTELVRALGAKLDLAKLRQSLDGLVERFQNDPDVQRVLTTLREKLDALGK